MVAGRRRISAAASLPRLPRAVTAAIQRPPPARGSGPISSPMPASPSCGMRHRWTGSRRTASRATTNSGAAAITARWHLSIAAHAHADALSLELRHGGIDIFADPGTYCYLTEPDFRRYFRSTIGHNTLEISNLDQARYGGPFLWLDAPSTSCSAPAGWRAADWPMERPPSRLCAPRLDSRSTQHVTLDRLQRRLQISTGSSRWAASLCDWHFIWGRR